MIKVAIVGTGNISRMHLEAYTSFKERCEIVALCDIVSEKAENAKEKFNLTSAKVYDDHEKMLADESVSIDLVSVCTPPFCHAEISINSMRAGCDVLVEKPMAASLEECDRMIAVRDETGRLLSAVAQNRFRDPNMNLKKLLETGMIGRVLHAQVESFWWRGHCYYDLWWRGLWEKEGGGCTLNHAVHHIDLLAWMMGMPKKITAVISNAAHDNAEVEDISIALLEYEKGTIGQVTSSVIHHGEEQQLIFQGEKARISTPWKTYASVSRPNGFPMRNEALEDELNAFVESQPKLPYTAHTGQIENVLSAIETGGKPFIGGEDGRRTIEFITAIYKAGATHLPAELPLKKDDPFYTVDGILKNMPHFYEKTTAVENLEGKITLGSDYSTVPPTVGR